MENFTDPGYYAHLAVSQAVLQVLLRLSDSPIIPFNPVSLGEILEEKYSLLVEDLRQRAPSLKTGICKIMQMDFLISCFYFFKF